VTDMKAAIDLLVWVYNQRAGAENLIKVSTPAKNGAILAGIGRGRIHPEPRW